MIFFLFFWDETSLCEVGMKFTPKKVSLTLFFLINLTPKDKNITLKKRMKIILIQEGKYFAFFFNSGRIFILLK